MRERHLFFGFSSLEVEVNAKRSEVANVDREKEGKHKVKGARRGNVMGGMKSKISDFVTLTS